MKPLPDGWQHANLGDLVKPSKERFNPVDNENRPFIGLKHIESGTGSIIDQGNSSDTKSLKSVFTSGDILYGRLRPYLNKVTVPQFDGVCSTDILVFPKRKLLSSKYLSLFLLTPPFVQYATQNMSGVQHPRVKFDTLAEFLIPVAPLNEQVRIVGRVEELFSRLDAGVRSLQAAQTQLEQYRQTTLKQAYTGKLTQKWRIDNEVDDSFTSDNHHNLSTTLSESLRNGKSAKVSKTGKGTPILSLSAVTFNDFSESNVKICDLEVETTSDLWVKPEDFLIARSNTIDYVGLGALYQGQQDLFIFPDLMIRARFNKSIILPKFVQYYFDSKIARKYFKEKARGTSGSMPKINQTTINELKMPLPSIEEQKIVIELIEENLIKLNYIKQNLHSSLRYSERLRSSILLKAFEGGLVPQDSNDEPAQVLLEHIKTRRVKKRKLM